MAVEVTAADVIAIAPEFAGMDDAQIEPFIEIARDFVNETTWGSKAANGIRYLAAHLVKTLGIDADDATGNTDATGPITSERVGDLSRSYGSALSNAAHASLSDQMLATTRYGQVFVMYRKTLLITPMVT